MCEAIFTYVDDFCKFLNNNSILQKKKKRRKVLSESEIVTISILFHLSGYKNFKIFYLRYILPKMERDYTKKVSYNRFIELKNKSAITLLFFTQWLTTLSIKTKINIIDSTTLKACHIRRSYGHKALKSFAKKGHSSMGFFYGFKLHFTINEYGEIRNFTLSAGNIHDSSKKIIHNITKDLEGLLIADKGYIGVQKYLDIKVLKVVCKPRKNMKKLPYILEERLLLNKRGTIESVNNILKSKLSLEHSRHRSFLGFLSHVFSTIAAYFFLEHKPSVYPSKKHYSLKF